MQRWQNGSPCSFPRAGLYLSNPAPNISALMSEKGHQRRFESALATSALSRISDASLSRSKRVQGAGGHRPRPFLSELPCQFGGLLFAGVDHIDSAVIPRMFERKHHDFPDADES